MNSRKLKIFLISAIIATAGSSTLMAFDNTNILVEEAVNHIYQQRYQQAHQTLKQAYEQSPRHPGVHFNLGRLFELTGNFAEALKEYRLAASLDTSMVAARRGIARVTVDLKRNKAMSAQQAQQLQQSGSPAPVVQFVPEQQQPEKARIVTQTPVARAPIVSQRAGYSALPALPVLPSQPATKYSNNELNLPPLPRQVSAEAAKSSGEERAEKLLEAGKTEDAAIALQKILQINPDSPKAHYLLGKALSLQGDLFASIKHLEEAIRVEDRYYDAYFLLGRNYAKVNLLEDAIRNYQIYYGVKPQASVALEIARIYETMGNPNQANEFYSRANAMNPGNTNLQMRLNESEGNMANDLYLRGNHAYTMNQFDEAVNLFSQALATGNLAESARRDAARKVEVARFKVKESADRRRPAKEGYSATKRNYAPTSLKYYQLSDIGFRTNFTGPITIEWRGYIARKIKRHGREFLLMIKELSRDELDTMNRDRNDFRLNGHFNNQPTFLLAARKGGFPPFAREGQMITFNGTTDWQFYEVINDLGQAVKMPTLEFVSAYPDNRD